MKPYGILSDLHLHPWQAFSHVQAEGRNSRFGLQLNEIGRCIKEIKEAGGDTLYLTGDIFHVRGNIAPSILNPTMELFRFVTSNGMKVRAIPGNHDLEGKDSNDIGSAVTALRGCGVDVCNKTTLFDDDLVVMVPWFDKLADLRPLLRGLKLENQDHYTLMIHAPIDGVISGLPNCGLKPEELDALGFKRVASGHYHNHKEFDGGVYSVGAMSHLTWSDVGTKAGFLIVSDDEVKWHKSHLPEFIDIDGDMSEDDVKLIVPGNYVRAKITSKKASDEGELRSWLTECGAAGVLIRVDKEVKTSRAASGVTIKSGASLEASVGEFIVGKAFANQEALLLNCQKILAAASV